MKFEAQYDNLARLLEYVSILTRQAEKTKSDLKEESRQKSIAINNHALI